MRKCPTVDSQLANAVNKSLCQHTWFFLQHLCFAAIVDDDLDDIVRANMAAKLLSHQVPDSYHVGNPEINLPIRNQGVILFSRTKLLVPYKVV